MSQTRSPTACPSLPSSVPLPSFSSRASFFFVLFFLPFFWVQEAKA